MTDLDVRGWRLVEPGIHRGPRPDRVLTLADLAQRGVLEEFELQVAERFEIDRRTPALTTLHYALGVVTGALVAPLVVDGIALDASSDALGVLVDGELSPVATWIGDAVPDLGPGAARRLGARVEALLAPIAAQVSESADVNPRAVDVVIDDKLRGEGLRLQRHVGPSVPWPALDEMLDGVGCRSRRAFRTVAVRPDVGPAVEMPVPRVCCVLSTTTTCGACPTCPQHTAHVLPTRVLEWLASLDDAGFEYVTGRERMPGTPASRSARAHVPAVPS